MKKIVGILAGAAVLASSVFAVDFSARTVMEGSVLKGNKDGDFSLWQLNNKDQKDSDALIMSVAGDQAGASYKFWYNYANGDADLKVRQANVWFKPMDTLKVTLGHVSAGTYTEMIHWWKAPIGESISNSRSWNGKYSSYASVEGEGVLVTMNPIDGLEINAGIAAGTDNAFVTKDTYSAYGVSAKYNLAGATGLPMSVALAWRDAGKDAVKVFAVGADYGNNWAEGFYGFLNVRMLLNDGLKGIAFDNYFKYATGALKVMARVPFILRTSGDKGDPSYFEYEVKLEYALDACTVYAFVASDLDNAGEIAVDNIGDDFKAQVQPGVTFSVGTCALDLGLRVNYAKDKLEYAVPFSASVSF